VEETEVRRAKSGAASSARPNLNESVEPLGRRLLIRKDESRQKTRGGIVLPDKAEIPTITGRIVEVSAQIERDQDFPVRKYDKVLFHPKNAIPVDFEADNLLFVVPIEDVVAVFRKVGKTKRPKVVADSDPDPDFDQDEGS
jgi:chaperonin GroES